MAQSYENIVQVPGTHNLTPFPLLRADLGRLTRTADLALSALVESCTPPDNTELYIEAAPEDFCAGDPYFSAVRETTGLGLFIVDTTDVAGHQEFGYYVDKADAQKVYAVEKFEEIWEPTADQRAADRTVRTVLDGELDRFASYSTYERSEPLEPILPIEGIDHGTLLVRAFLATTQFAVLRDSPGYSTHLPRAMKMYENLRGLGQSPLGTEELGGLALKAVTGLIEAFKAETDTIL